MRAAVAARERSPKQNLRKNDMVMVIAGKERGKTGKVLRVLVDDQRVVIERLNMVKRHRKARGVQSPGGVVEKEASIHLSNVMIMCERCNAPARVGRRRQDDGTAVRVCRRCSEVIDR